MSVFGNRAFMEVTGVKCGPKGKALIPSDWYPYENKTHHNSPFLRTRRVGVMRWYSGKVAICKPERSPHQKPDLFMLQSWMSSPQNCKKINFCCLSHPTCGILLWQLKLIHCAAAKSLQSCPTLCDPIDGSPPGSPVPGIHQARTLEWVAISFSNVWKWKVEVKSLSRVRLLATPLTAAYQAPPSMGFSRQEYWSGVPL